MKCTDLKELLRKLPANRHCHDAKTLEESWHAHNGYKNYTREYHGSHFSDTEQENIFTVWICTPISTITGYAIFSRNVWYGEKNDKPSGTRIILLPLERDLQNKYDPHKKGIDANTLSDVILETNNWEEVVFAQAGMDPGKILLDRNKIKDLGEYIEYLQDSKVVKV